MWGLVQVSRLHHRASSLQNECPKKGRRSEEAPDPDGPGEANRRPVVDFPLGSDAEAGTAGTQAGGGSDLLADRARMNPVTSTLRRSLAFTETVRFFRSWRARARHHALIKKHGLSYYSPLDTLRGEVRARDLLRRAEVSAEWVPRRLYPAGGAAGPLLLYCLIRALEELPIQRVLELGAGQSTKLLDAWSRSRKGRFVTFEQDADWAARIAGECDSSSGSVLHLPLVPISTPAGPGHWYAPPPAGALPEEGFDLLLVDGPVGTRRFSRYGIVEHIPEWLGEEWGILWDDLDRVGDLESFAALIERLRAAHVVHDHLLLQGDRMIGVVFTPAFTPLRFLW